MEPSKANQNPQLTTTTLTESERMPAAQISTSNGQETAIEEEKVEVKTSTQTRLPTSVDILQPDKRFGHSQIPAGLIDQIGGGIESAVKPEDDKSAAASGDQNASGPQPLESINLADFDCLQTKGIRMSSPKTQEQKRKMLEKRQQALCLILADDSSRQSLTDKRRRNIIRLLWVIDGLLVHNLTLKELVKVLHAYERLDQVPEGYEIDELLAYAAAQRQQE